MTTDPPAAEPPPGLTSAPASGQPPSSLTYLRAVSRKTPADEDRAEWVAWWAACTAPRWMHHGLPYRPRAHRDSFLRLDIDRRFRLLAGALVRLQPLADQVWCHLWADGLERGILPPLWPDSQPLPGPDEGPRSRAFVPVGGFLVNAGRPGISFLVDRIVDRYVAGWRGRHLSDALPAVMADLIRDVFPVPDPRPTALPPCPIDPSWRTTTVVELARLAWEAVEFSSLPVLADALQDAGCGRADVLEHLRSDRPHCRGCWVLDAVLGKSLPGGGRVQS